MAITASDVVMHKRFHLIAGNLSNSGMFMLLKKAPHRAFWIGGEIESILALTGMVFADLGHIPKSHRGNWSDEDEFVEIFGEFQGEFQSNGTAHRMSHKDELRQTEMLGQ